MTWLRLIHSGSPASISDLLSWAFSFVGIAEVSDSQIKVSRLAYAVISLFFHPFQQLKSSLRYPGHWSWSILLIHSHSMEPFWTRALSLILLLQHHSWSVRFSDKCKLSTGLVTSFLCRFWHNRVLFIQSLGFSLRESCRKFGQRSRWGGPTPIAKSFFYLVRLLEVESDAFSLFVIGLSVIGLLKQKFYCLIQALMFDLSRV